MEGPSPALAEALPRRYVSPIHRSMPVNLQIFLQPPNSPGPPSHHTCILTRQRRTGFDLEGNTYWEFRLTRGASSSPSSGDGPGERWRRIVQYPRSTHLSQVRVGPQWHQWLRHTRPDPPSLGEQRGDEARRGRLRVLAAQADARWEAKPRLVGEPGGASAPMLPRPGGGDVIREGAEAGGAEQQKPAEEQEKLLEKQEKKQAERQGEAENDDPWAQAKSRGPTESWQPSAWDPAAKKNR